MPRDAEIRLRDRLSKLSGLDLLRGARLSGELERLQRQLDRIEAEPTDAEIWRSVELARHQDRPYTLDYVERIFEDFFELHGDRGRADDAALVTGLGRLEGRTVALIGHQKGRDIKERTTRNFGMAYPEGYRKAMRVMELADRQGFPLVTLVDTPGAYPGVAAEQHGQGGAIARCQAVMARLGVPTVACIIGEGGSGGAVAIALADRVLMQENAIYSVSRPRAARRFSGATRARPRRRPRRSNRTPPTAWSSASSTGSSRSRSVARTSSTTRPPGSSRRRSPMPSRSSTISPGTSCGQRAGRSSALWAFWAERGARRRNRRFPHLPQAYPRAEIARRDAEAGMSPASTRPPFHLRCGSEPTRIPTSQ